MKINLKTYDVLPTIVNGKVIALDCPYGKQLNTSVGGKSVSLINVGKYTTIDAVFNPIHYDILVTDKYQIIVNANNGIYLDAVVDYLKNSTPSSRAAQALTDYRAGDKVHLNGLNGIYEIVSIDKNWLYLTCKKWELQGKGIKFFLRSEIKCLAGGLHNKFR